MANKRDVYLRCAKDPQWESENIKLGKKPRPLRGPQASVVRAVEKHVARHDGETMCVRQSRQTGKNEVSALLHRRHLWRRQNHSSNQIWIRTAPTWKPQITNSKKRLRELLALTTANTIKFPLFNGSKLQKEEGYIWRVGNASVEFISSGPNANVVGGTANVCLDMDEAHKVTPEKFDEDFAPMAADTSAAIVLWGVASDGLDLISFYHDHNKAIGRPDLNIDLPCEIWMEGNPNYEKHVNARVKALGWDHPIIKTQYRLLNVASEGNFLQPRHVRALFSGEHQREIKPDRNSTYEMLIDVAASNEQNVENALEGDGDTETDSTVVWIYKVMHLLTPNGIYPFIHIVNMYWFTGANLPSQEREIKELIPFWRIGKVTVDGIGVGRGLSESLQEKFGEHMVNMYTATPTSVSEDCFDLLARLHHQSVLMFQDDGSEEFKEFERQCGWTKYESKEGRMKLKKPQGAKKHIDMVKALTYINRNSPQAGVVEFLSEYSDRSI